jgi:hypothetical protein
VKIRTFKRRTRLELNYFMSRLGEAMAEDKFIGLRWRFFCCWTQLWAKSASLAQKRVLTLNFLRSASLLAGGNQTGPKLTLNLSMLSDKIRALLCCEFYWEISANKSNARIEEAKTRGRI